MYMSVYVCETTLPIHTYIHVWACLCEVLFEKGANVNEKATDSFISVNEVKWTELEGVVDLHKEIICMFCQGVVMYMYVCIYTQITNQDVGSVFLAFLIMWLSYLFKLQKNIIKWLAL